MFKVCQFPNIAVIHTSVFHLERKIMKVRLILSVALCVIMNSIFAQIPNDDCDDATLIEVLVEDQKLDISGNMFFSTPSYYGNISCGYPWYNDLWYKFVAPTDEVIFSSTGGINILVYEGDCNNVITTGCYVSAIATIPEETYFIRLTSTDTNLGLFTFSAFYKEYNYVPEDSCLNAMSIDIGLGSVEGDTININAADLSDSTAGYCGNTSANDAWYIFTAPANGSVELEVLSGSLSHFSILENDCLNPSTIHCYGSTSYPFAYNLIGGESYLLKVHPFGSSTLSFTVKEGIESISNFSCDNSEYLDFLNDGDDTLSVNLTHAYNEIDPFCAYSQHKRSAWYEFVAPMSGAISLESLNGNQFRYSVYGGLCSTLNSVVCNTVLSTSVRYINALTPGESYYIRLELRLSGQHDALIAVTEVDPVSNDDCGNAVEILLQSGGTCNTAYTLDSNGALQSAELSTCYAHENKIDIWFYFVGPSSGSVEFLDGLSDAEKTIYTGSCGSLSPLTCVSGSTLRGVTSGETYYMQVTRYSATIETTGCIVELSETVIDNDICSNSTALTDQMIATIDATQYAIENGDDPTCDINPHDMWYTFTTPSSELSSIKFSDDADLDYVIYSGSCGSLTEIGCFQVFGNEYNILDDLSPSTDYTLQIFSHFNQESDAVSMTYNEIDLVENNFCDGATALNDLSENCKDYHVDFRYTTLSDVPLPSSINYSTPTDTWRHFNTGNYTIISVSNESFGSNEIEDFYLAVYSYDCNNLVEIGVTSKVTGFGTRSIKGLLQNTDYYIRLIAEENLFGEMCLGLIPFNEQDECSTATEIIVSENACLYSELIDVEYATKSEDETICNESSTIKDVWRYFTVPVSGSITVEVQSYVTTTITVYSGSCGALTELACGNLPDYGNFQIDNLIANETYYLRYTSNGSDLICLYTVPLESEESQCTEAIPLSISTDENCDQKISGSTSDAGTSNGLFCGRTITTANFYSITPIEDGYHTIAVSNAAASHNVSLYTDCVLDPPLVCGESEISYTLQSGNNYIVAVFPTLAGQSSSYDVCAYETIASESENLGISVPNPQVKLDVNGGIKPAYSDKTIAGNIRWSGELEVYDGGNWQNLR